MKPKANFVMKGYTSELVNTYYCKPCKDSGIEHEVIKVPGPHTDSGIPTTLRRCTGCLAEDGPWVSADHVGGGW